MEDKTTNNIGTEPEGAHWKSTMDHPSDSPWDSTGQKENAWETLHGRLQVKSPQGLHLQQGLRLQGGLHFGFRARFYAAAVLLGVALLTGIGIAIKNKHTLSPSNTVTSSASPDPRVSQSGVNQPGVNQSGVNQPSESQSIRPIGSVAASPLSAADLVSTNKLKKVSGVKVSKVAPTAPEALATTTRETVVTMSQEPMATMTQAPNASVIQAKDVPKVPSVHAPLKVISINELEGSHDDASQDKNVKTLHTLQIQWLHQSPHAEISYQDDKTPNAGIQLKVH
jgi:hypothetical protein